MRSNFVPAGATTGIGSLPYTSVDSAIQFIAELAPEIPFWPQMPQISDIESIIGQGLGLLADLIDRRSEGYGYEVKDGRIDAVLDRLHRSHGELNSAGFNAFLEARFPMAIAIKGQIEGPITLAAYLFYKGRPFLSDPALFAAIAFHVSQMVCWQIERLQRFDSTVLLFVDEPALCLETADRGLSALAAILNDARSRGAYAGLHCCAARPFERMCLVQPDILSFDAHEGLEAFFADEHALKFLRHGGVVAYGLVPTWKSLDGLEPASIFTRWLAAASMASDPEELAQRAMVTATCGLGLLDPHAAAASFRVAQGVGRLIRQSLLLQARSSG